MGLKIRHLGEYLVFRLLLCVWQILSPRNGQRLAENLAWVICTLLPGKLVRAHVVRENLQRAFDGQLSDRQIADIQYRMWVHFLNLFAELALISRKLNLRTTTSVIEFRRISDAVQMLAGDRPVIFVSGHFGNWELVISVIGSFGFPMSLVARELDNPWLQGWFARFREQTGHHLIAKRNCFDEMRQALESGGCLALLGDQDAGRGGIFVDFFGSPASTLKTIALLSREYDAPVCVGTAHRLAQKGEHWSRFDVGVEAIIDPRDVTGDDPVAEISQKFTHALQDAILRAPEQYFWLHKRWKTRPGDREAKRQARKRAA